MLHHQAQASEPVPWLAATAQGPHHTERFCRRTRGPGAAAVPHPNQPNKIKKKKKCPQRESVLCPGVYNAMSHRTQRRNLVVCLLAPGCGQVALTEARLGAWSMICCRAPSFPKSEGCVTCPCLGSAMERSTKDRAPNQHAESLGSGRDGVR